MVAVRSKQSGTESEVTPSIQEQGALITVSGTALDVIGKVGMAIGTTGLLMYVFTMLEAMMGFGVVYSGAAIIAVGVASAAIASKLRTGSWLKGILG